MSATTAFSNNTDIPEIDSQQHKTVKQDLGAYILLGFKTESLKMPK